MECTINASVKLYHPRGALVTLPVPPDPQIAFEHVARCLDIGWLVTAPGLEEGEHREDVGYVLRGIHDQTPFLLLYSTNQGYSFSFLKVYLNTGEDIAAFEHASKMKFNAIPEYIGADKPERGKNPKLDAFIVPSPKPFGVVQRNNPKYREDEQAAAAARREVYKTPKRLFVRWVDQQPTTTAEQPAAAPASAPASPPPSANGTAGPKTPPPAKKKPANRNEACAMLIDFAKIAKTKDVLDNAFLSGRRKFQFTADQDDLLNDARHEALERLGELQPAPGQGSNIPF